VNSDNWNTTPCGDTPTTQRYTLDLGFTNCKAWIFPTTSFWRRCQGPIGLLSAEFFREKLGFSLRRLKQTPLGGNWIISENFVHIVEDWRFASNAKFSFLLSFSWFQLLLLLLVLLMLVWFLVSNCLVYALNSCLLLSPFMFGRTPFPIPCFLLFSLVLGFNLGFSSLVDVWFYFVLTWPMISP